MMWPCAGQCAVKEYAAVSIEVGEKPDVKQAVWNRRHLLDLEDLSKAEVETILTRTEEVHEHPTQGLLDIFTILHSLGRVEGLTVGLVGDIAHSRVARSNIHGLLKLGAHVIVCGPPTLVPPSISKLGVEISYRLDDILPR